MKGPKWGNVTPTNAKINRIIAATIIANIAIPKACNQPVSKITLYDPRNAIKPMITPIIGDMKENIKENMSNTIAPIKVANIALPKVVVLGVIIFPAIHVGIETIIHTIIKAIMKAIAPAKNIAIIFCKQKIKIYLLLIGTYCKDSGPM